MSLNVENDSQQTNVSKFSLSDEKRSDFMHTNNSSLSFLQTYTEHTKHFLNIETSHIQKFFDAQYEQNNRVNCELIVCAARALIKWHESARHETTLLDKMIVDAENRNQALNDQAKRLNVFQFFIDSLPSIVLNQSFWYDSDNSFSDTMEYDNDDKSQVSTTKFNLFHATGNTSSSLSFKANSAAEMKLMNIYNDGQLETCQMDKPSTNQSAASVMLSTAELALSPNSILATDSSYHPESESSESSTSTDSSVLLSNNLSMLTSNISRISSGLIDSSESTDFSSQAPSLYIVNPGSSNTQSNNITDEEQTTNNSNSSREILTAVTLPSVMSMESTASTHSVIGESATPITTTVETSTSNTGAIRSGRLLLQRRRILRRSLNRPSN